LNLGFTEWDSPDHVVSNRKNFYSAVGAPKMRPVLLRQIHSDLIYVVRAGDVPQGENAPQADALITASRVCC